MFFFVFVRSVTIEVTRYDMHATRRNCNSRTRQTTASGCMETVLKLRV